VVVPRIAVINGPDSNYVYAVNAKGIVRQIPVTIQFDNGTDMAVQGALKGGDKVITDGGLRVLPGSKVTFRSVVTRPAGGKGARGARGARGKAAP
jgi:multidrug efflux pump subunit AcrA (membrane-fusion protein)